MSAMSPYSIGHIGLRMGPSSHASPKAAKNTSINLMPMKGTMIPPTP